MMDRPTRTLVAASGVLALAFASVPAVALAADATEDTFAIVFSLLMVFFVTVVSMCMYAIVPMAMIATLTLVVIALVDLVNRRDDEFPGALQGTPNPNEKMMWLLIVLLAGLLGSIFYVVLVKRKYPVARLRGTVPPAAPGE
jgi:TctA family transporter